MRTAQPWLFLVSHHFDVCFAVQLLLVLLRWLGRHETLFILRLPFDFLAGALVVGHYRAHRTLVFEGQHSTFAAALLQRSFHFRRRHRFREDIRFMALVRKLCLPIEFRELLHRYTRVRDEFR